MDEQGVFPRRPESTAGRLLRSPTSPAPAFPRPVSPETGPDTPPGDGERRPCLSIDGLRETKTAKTDPPLEGPSCTH